MGSPPPPEVLAGWAQRRRQEEQRRALALASAVAGDVDEDVEGAGVDAELYRSTNASTGFTIVVTNRVILSNNPASGQITQIPVRQITNITKSIEGFLSQKYCVTIYYFAGQEFQSFCFSDPSGRDHLFNAIQHAMSSSWGVLPVVNEHELTELPATRLPVTRTREEILWGRFKDNPRVKRLTIIGLVILLSPFWLGVIVIPIALIAELFGCHDLMRHLKCA